MNDSFLWVIDFMVNPFGCPVLLCKITNVSFEIFFILYFPSVAFVPSHFFITNLTHFPLHAYCFVEDFEVVRESVFTTISHTR